MIQFLKLWREGGLRVALYCYPFHRWSNWSWFLVASPLMRFAMGPRPGEKWYQGWWEWPKIERSV